jgi:hypothetical protein
MVKLQDILQFMQQKNRDSLQSLLSKCQEIQKFDANEIEMDFTTRRLLEESVYFETNDFQYPAIKSLIILAFNPTEEIRYHPFFLQVLKNITNDEFLMLNNISKNNYEFTSSYDYSNEKGFYNYKRILFQYPKDELQYPPQFDFYINNLMGILKLINWPIYNQEPIMEDKVQTGLMEYSHLELEKSGKFFLDSIKFGL